MAIFFSAICFCRYQPSEAILAIISRVRSSKVYHTGLIKPPDTVDYKIYSKRGLHLQIQRPVRGALGGSPGYDIKVIYSGFYFF